MPPSLAERPRPSAGSFLALRRMLHEEAGITLGEGKEALVSARLSRRLRALGLPSFDAYVAWLGEHPAERVALVNSLTTNKTDFFRENHHFEFLERHLPPLVRARESSGRRTLRVWSAGCSTGEEPWSIAMTLRQLLAERPGWDIRVLATDIDTDVLARAEAGVYADDRVAPIPERLRERYLARRPDGWHVRDSLRELVHFRRVDLVHDTFRVQPATVDVLFCRNVMIYFSNEDRDRLLEKFRRVLSPEGWFFVGHSESLQRRPDQFRFVQYAVYQRAGAR